MKLRKELEKISVLASLSSTHSQAARLPHPSMVYPKIHGGKCGQKMRS